MNSKLLIYSIFFVFIYPNTYAQNSRIDSLKFQLEKKSINDTTRINLLNEIGWAYLNPNPDSSWHYSEKALGEARKNSYTHGIAHAFLNMGRILRSKTELPKALDYFIKAIKLYESDRDMLQVAHTYTDIAIVHFMNDNNDLSEKYLIMARDLFIQLNDKTGIAYSYNNLGILHDLNHEDSLAIHFFQEALMIKKEIGNKKDIGETILNIGAFYEDRKNYPEALKYYKESYPYFKDVGKWLGIINAYQGEANVFYEIGKLDSARYYLDLSLQIAVNHGAKGEITTIMHSLAKNYSKTGNYKEAMEMFEEMIDLKDSLYNEENAHQMAEMQTKYETEKKEKEIELLEARQIISSRTKVALIVGLILVASISALIIYLMRLRIRKKSYQHQLAASKLELAKKELKFKQMELDNFTKVIQEKNKVLEQLKSQFDKEALDEDHKYENINKLTQAIILTEDDWEDFKIIFEEVHENFFNKLRINHPELTVSEVRLAALMKLNLNNKEISNMLGVSPESVIKSKYRLKKKLDLSGENKLEKFIKEI